jgi:hypothetical protein
MKVRMNKVAVMAFGLLTCMQLQGKALVGAGANVLLTDKDGKTALDILIETRDAYKAPAYKGFVEACNEHIDMLTKSMELQKWHVNQ